MGSKIATFPVFCRVIREFDSREWFASDCVIRHAVRDFAFSPEKWGIQRMFATFDRLKGTGES